MPRVHFAPLLLFAACSAPSTDAAAPLRELVELVQREYVRDVPAHELAAVGRDAMLRSLDPYSSYLDPALYADLKLSLVGRFGGVGMRLDFDAAQQQVVVRGPLRGSPALAAGVLAGDAIETVDGRPLAGLAMEEVLGRLRGVVGTAVDLGVRREGCALTLRFVRAPIELASVRGWSRNAQGRADHDLPGSDVAYVRIAHFAATTAREVEVALADAAAAGSKAVVLDLRQNQGGLLRSAIEVADLFLDSGTIVQLHRRGAPVEEVAATHGVATTLPLAVLVDGGTKSAAEVLAACLRDHRRAAIVGQRSFGKGTVQQLFPLADGGAFALTIEHYLPPSGRPIERHFPGADPAAGGVWPDQGLAVEQDAEELARLVAAMVRADDDASIVGAPTEALPVAHDRAVATACEALAAAR